MSLEELFGKTVNAFISNTEKGFSALGLERKILENTLKAKKKIISGEKFDILLDHKPTTNHLYLCLSPKKMSKKIVKQIKEKSLDFKSLLIHVGDVYIFDRSYELRIGALGSSSSDLTRAVIKYKK